MPEDPKPKEFWIKHTEKGWQIRGEPGYFTAEEMHKYVTEKYKKSGNPGKLALDCECEEGIRPFKKVLEGTNCKCGIYFREDTGLQETGAQIQLGVVTMELKKFKGETS